MRYDKSSKWLIEHHGDGLLRLAGVCDIVSWKPLQAELVQPRQLPDGLLEFQRRGHDRSCLALLEIATYPERRVHQQVMRDVVMTWMARRVVPDVLVLVLHPRGRVRVQSQAEYVSDLGTTRLAVQWRVVELWEQPAEALLKTGDVGLIPLAPLTKFDGLPETLLRECRAKIDAHGLPDEHENLLSVTQVMASLRFDRLLVQSILGGSLKMTEFPLIVELRAEIRHDAIRDFLKGRFGEVPDDVIRGLESITKDKHLRELTRQSGSCKSIDAFRKHMAKYIK